ncbi:MAG: hypothetical protein WC663_01845 [Patescibacteria group bacterium]|jgi:hypothetical protein
MRRAVLIVLSAIIFSSNAFAQKQLTVPKEIVVEMEKTGCQVIPSYVSTQSNYINFDIDNQNIPKCVVIPIAANFSTLTFLVQAPYNYDVTAEFSDGNLQFYRHQKERSKLQINLWNCFNLGRNSWLFVKVSIYNQDPKAQPNQKIYFGARARQ